MNLLQRFCRTGRAREELDGWGSGGALRGALADAVFAPNSGLPAEIAVTQLRDAETMVSGSKELALAFDSPAVQSNARWR